MRPTHAILVLAAVLLCGCSVPEDAPVSAVSPSPSPPGEPEDLTRPLPDPLPDVVARVNGQAIHLAEVVPLLHTTA